MLCDAFPNDADNDIDSDGIGGDVDNCPSVDTRVRRSVAQADAELMDDSKTVMPSRLILIER